MLSELGAGGFGQITLEGKDKTGTLQHQLNRATELLGISTQYRWPTADVVLNIFPPVAWVPGNRSQLKGAP